MTLLAHTVEAGVSAAARGVGRARSKRAVQRAEPQTCADLVAQVGAMGASGAPRASEVTAAAISGPSGPATAPLSGLECAWYLVRVYERFAAWRPGPLGPTRVERQVKVAEQVSGRLTIRDHTGSVRVDPAGAEYSLGTPSFSGFEARVGGDGSLMDEITRTFGVPLRPRHRNMTVGFLVEEWIVREGEDMHVVGQARGEGVDVVLGKPAMRPFVVARRAATPVLPVGS
jgi:hypothetical protein